MADIIEHDPPDHAICGAKNRQGYPCGNAPLANGRCRFHGGLSLKGVASPTFKHGRYSKYMPERLMSRFSDAMNDPRLLEQRAEIALLDTRLGTLLENIDDGVSISLWADLNRAWASFEAAYKSKDQDSINNALRTVGRLIQKGGEDAEVWDSIQSTIEQRRKVVESERKRYVEAQEILTLQEVMVFFSRFNDIVARNVTDPVALRNISHELASLSDSVVS